jgi:saccharopine dehydrogenase-like NADP-dependent oxidoreductase
MNTMQLSFDEYNSINTFEEFKNSQFAKNIIDAYQDLARQILDTSSKAKKSYSYKFGKLAGKTYNFITRKETKTSFLISAWAVETVVVAISINLMILTGSIISAMLLAAFHLYTTYALFTIIANQK